MFITIQIVHTVFLIQVSTTILNIALFLSKIVEISLVFITPIFNESAHCAELKLSFKCLFDRMNEWRGENNCTTAMQSIMFTFAQFWLVISYSFSPQDFWLIMLFFY